MKKVINRGFTLIELLVVIAIIGILASIVLVSLNSARNKGKDTRVISDVNQVRTQLESDLGSGIYPDLYNALANQTGATALYTTNGPGAANLTTLNADANTNGGANMTIYVNTNGTVGNATTPNATTYAIYGKTSTGYFCVDYTGNNKTNATNGTIPAAGSATCQ
jgi:prepilin-type N-terminal cleavage/methylation domain-containing protein